MDQIEEQTLCKEEYQNVNSYHEILIGTNFFIYIPHHAEYTRFLTLHTHLLYIIHAFSHFTHTTTIQYTRFLTLHTHNAIQYTRFLTLHTHTYYTVYTLSHTSHTRLLYSIHAFSVFTHTTSKHYTPFLTLHTHSHTFYTLYTLSLTSHTPSIHFRCFLILHTHILYIIHAFSHFTPLYTIDNKFTLVYIPHCILYI